MDVTKPSGKPPYRPSVPVAGGSSPLRVILDFDGTLVEPNVAIVLVEEFAPDGHRVAHEVDELLHTGKIGLREAWQRQASLLPSDRIPEMAEFVRDRVPLRRGAHDFLKLSRERGIGVTVLSGGLDFYIHTVLEREGLDLPVRSDRLTVLPSGAAQVDHPFGHPTCRLCGICKAGVVSQTDVAARTVFIADGSTDKYGAEVADIIFARRRLLDYCRRAGLDCYPFEDFEPVTNQMRRWLDGVDPLPPHRRLGLASSSCPISPAEAHREGGGAGAPMPSSEGASPTRTSPRGTA